MILFYKGRASLRGRLLGIAATLILSAGAVAQNETVSAPLSADDVMERVAAMDNIRAKSLAGYSSIRTYHLECQCMSHKTADMVVRTSYRAPDKEEFTIVSSTGSDTVRERVFKKLLEAEKESLELTNQQHSAITHENYVFHVSDYVTNDSNEVYVIDAQPRNRNKFLFRGRIWVDAKDFAITRVDGEPAVNPSWWTEKTDFKCRFQKVGDFWLPESNESKTKVRVLGTALLSIEYRDYQITGIESDTLAYSQHESLRVQ